MTNRSWAAALLATACVADAVCGLHVATADGVSAILIVFSVVAVVGAGLAVSGWLRQLPGHLGVGLLLQVAAPTAFAWVLSLVLAVLGVGILLRQRRSQPLAAPSSR